jgi:hypothetical protein
LETCWLSRDGRRARFALKNRPFSHGLKRGLARDLTNDGS